MMISVLCAGQFTPQIFSKCPSPGIPFNHRFVGMTPVPICTLLSRFGVTNT